MRVGPDIGRPRRSYNAVMRVTNRLASFLEDPARPPETLRHHELQGFLFAVASCPELVPPSDWMPEIFGAEDAGYESLDEAQAILGELMVAYNEVTASVTSERAELPSDCRFRKKTLANFDDDAAISQWSRGFKRGYLWLEDSWEELVPEEFDSDFSALLIVLTFFASRRLADEYLKELGRPDPEELATDIRRMFPDAVAEYARIGRSIQKLLIEHEARIEPRKHDKVGRNDPCPCGSGRKYKKCHGADTAQ